MSTPAVSIIIATHNRARLLPTAIESALAAGPDVEVVVVDDASRDETPAVCRRFPQIHCLRLARNRGLAGARNAGLRASRGTYLAFLDDDDRRLPDSLPRQLELLEQNPTAVLCYARVRAGDEGDGEPEEEAEQPSGDVFWRLLRANFVPVLSVVMRRDPIFQIGLLDESLREIEDWDLWLRLSERWPFVALPSAVAVYRNFDRNSGQLSSNRARMVIT
nr:glycosyltransferase [Verrucomicrobiota bacterium]